MLASFLRTKRGQKHEQRPLLFRGQEGRPAREDGDSEEESDPYDGSSVGRNEQQHQAILPIFSAQHLDRIPVYHLQHSIRLLILEKCETTLSWDQLRTPQISQFLVKPIQQRIRASYLSRATLYALLANCLQFQKDAQTNPGIVGVSKTRGLMCELLAMRMLKESSTRELIDALFYDFDPLQGLVARTGTTTPATARAKPNARISAVEIGIRAHAKRFLAHPLVVQQLEAVWAGTIVFHSAADTLHRVPIKGQSQEDSSYGAIGGRIPLRPGTEQAKVAKGKERANVLAPVVRRSVTLYDPRDASLFKLSRLRVPRYRQLFSTLSYAIMLGLFLSVLIERSLDITGWELVFWFWSAGYMLDELVGFSEQGFGLYIMSVWNSFDIGILLLFVVYYVLRLYGILMPDVRKKDLANMAYDVLASTGVLLLPRLFSVLDHYRYFSQLLIAFRMMAMDLAAILILIVISCSGFFVAFIFSGSGRDFSAASAAYALFQIVMGFTPAAWEVWDDYNILGKAILSIFLLICHFLIVTILITVLTNSFMAVVQNANEEHQFLFAVNVLSTVKSDALFSYIPPANIVGWLLAPLRYIMPFASFVRLNRTIIKISHAPILFAVFLYERLILMRWFYEPIDFVEERGRGRPAGRLPMFPMKESTELFSPGARLREPSVTTFRKDRALEEVFRRPFQGQRPGRDGRDGDESTRRNPVYERSKPTNVVQDWMSGVGREGGATSPVEQPRSVLDKLESRKPGFRRALSTRAVPSSRAVSGGKSVASDPEEPRWGLLGRVPPIQEDTESPDMSMTDLPQQTDADGDDELATNDEDDGGTVDRSFETGQEDEGDSDKENRQFFSLRGQPSKPLRQLSQSFGTPTNRDEAQSSPTPTAKIKFRPLLSSTPRRDQLVIPPNQSPSQQRASKMKRDREQHTRTVSSTTILFAPRDAAGEDDEDAIEADESLGKQSQPSATKSGTDTPGDVVMTPRRSAAKRPVVSPVSIPAAVSVVPRPIPTMLPARKYLRSAPDFATLLELDRRKPSFNAMALDLASDLGDNRIVPDVGMLSGSWDTQLEMAAVRRRRRPVAAMLASAASVDVDEDDEDDDEEEDDDDRLLTHRFLRVGRSRGGGGTRRLNRLMLARMTDLEEGFREVLKEVKGLSRGAGSVGGESADSNTRRLMKEKESDIAVAEGSGPV